jgi:putative ABC transport system ATP-binding protein
MKPIIKAEGLSKIYGSGNSRTAAVTGASFEACPGEIIAVTGPSGCGKTTLLNMAGLVIPPTEGKLFLNGRDASGLSERERADCRNAFFGYVVQEFALVEDETVYENIEIPLLYSKQRPRRSERLARIEAMLERFGLKNRIREKVGNLSGGQRQRVAIIRAVINHPKVILADEPTGALDAKNSEDVFSILKQQAIEEEKTVIMVTHNESLAKRCTRSLTMLDGKLV